MDDSFFHIAYFGPGGLELLVVMLVLLVMFGAKDAPRILRKITGVIGQIRNTAENFKREVMYSDLESEKPNHVGTDNGDDSNYGDYDYDIEEDYYHLADEESDASDAVFNSIEKELDAEGMTKLQDVEELEEEGDDVSKA